MNKQVAIVILNYENSRDTINCIKSIRLMQYKELAGIIVVDNNSSKAAVRLLIDNQHEYKYKVIQLKHNWGFAKGNNVGIKYAREKINAKYVLVVNNDTIFTDSEMINKMINQSRPTDGIIGPSIKLRNGFIQKPFYQHTKFPYLIYQYLFYWLSYFGLDIFADSLYEKIRKNKEIVLHGSVLMFTPAFFEYYDGFYAGTFMYGEEAILQIMLEKVGLTERQVSDTEIIHLEDQSTDLTVKNINLFKSKNHLKSGLQAIIVRIIPYRVLRKIKIRC